MVLHETIFFTDEGIFPLFTHLLADYRLRHLVNNVALHIYIYMVLIGKIICICEFVLIFLSYHFHHCVSTKNQLFRTIDSQMWWTHCVWTKDIRISPSGTVPTLTVHIIMANMDTQLINKLGEKYCFLEDNLPSTQTT